METRRDQYMEFQRCLSKLLLYAWARDIIVKGNEWWRTFQQAAENARRKTGIKNSKHCYSLAVDMYIVGKTGKEVLWGVDKREYALYKILGDYWKGLGMVWGDDIRKWDVYHFEYCNKPAR